MADDETPDVPDEDGIDGELPEGIDPDTPLGDMTDDGPADDGPAEDSDNAPGGPSEGSDDPPAGFGGPSEGVIEIDGVIPIEIQTEMEQSFLDYAMSVIVSRALPDARDGLKPVHRRIIWGMFDSGHRPDRSHVKSARVVGDVMGKYHPHGDTAIYDALVRMAQDFSLRNPLIDPHGNFGTPADGPAAMRYTECRLAPLAMRLVDGIDKDTVNFKANFDGSTDEPEVLPARFPNLLVNGSQGIAVGMATNIPPHNLNEVIDATLHLLDNGEATPDDLMQFVKGPDFPTGGYILGRSGLESAYRTGKGSIKMRARAEIEEDDKGSRIVVTELCYQTNNEQLEKKVADLVNRKIIDGIRSYVDESSGDDTRIVFHLKRDAPALVVLNQLYKYTNLQTTFSANMVALDDGIPRTLNLRDALVAYVDHQREVIRRRSQHDLDKAQARMHILEGLLKAIDMIDEIIALIRGSEDRPAARDGLMGPGFAFSEIQAKHILDMPLGRLTRLGRIDIEKEMAEIREQIEELEEILRNPAVLDQVIKDELNEVREEFGSPRRTEFTHDPGEFDIEDLIEDEPIVFTMSDTGYVKTVAVDEFRVQSRGGRGVAGANLKDGDAIDTIIHTTAHAYLLFFTSFGKVYRLKAHQIPMKSRTAKGMAIVNLLQLDPDEIVAAIVDTRDYEANEYLLFVTKNGQAKRTEFSAYDTNRANGLIAIGLRDGDELVQVLPTNSVNDACIVTRKGRLMRFPPEEVRPMGRSAGGVRGIKLKEGDEVVSVCFARDGHELAVITDEGFGKRTPFADFSTKHRGGQGVTAIKLNDAKGQVLAALMVEPEDELILMSSQGTTIRLLCEDISVQGAYATGVTVMALKEGEQVAAVTRVTAADVAAEAEAAEKNGATGEGDDVPAATDEGEDASSDDGGSDDRGSDDRGSGDRGSDDRGSDDRGSDDGGGEEE